MLFRSMHFSESGVRKQIRRLRKLELLDVGRSARDRRVIIVRATPELFRAFEAYDQIISDDRRRSGCGE